MFLTVEDMVARLGEEEMLQIAGTGPRDMRTLDRVRIEEDIASTTALIFGFVRARWPHVVPEGTPMLKGFGVDICRWRLRGRGGQATAMNEVVQKRYDEAMRALRDLSDGSLALDVDDEDAVGTAELNVSGSMPPARVPSMLTGWRP